MSEEIKLQNELMKEREERKGREERRSEARLIYENSPITADARIGIPLEEIARRYSKEDIVKVFVAADKQIIGLEERLEEELMNSVTDYLTKLKNMRGFQTELEEEFSKIPTISNSAQLNKIKHPLSLIVLDIDNFGAFNKEYSKQVGDDVLRQFGHVLKTMEEKYGCIPARVGGEEFAIITPYYAESEHKTQTTGIKLAHELRDSIRNHKFEYVSEKAIEKDGKEIIERTILQLPRITASIGITGYDHGGYTYFDHIWNKTINKGSDGAKEFVERAEFAANVSKHEGKDQVTLFSDARKIRKAYLSKKQRVQSAINHLKLAYASLKD